jgi:hypothetical protein
MKKNILLLEDFTDVDFLLIGISASLEMYRLAYFMNKHLNIKLAIQEKDIDFLYEDCEAKFPLYKYYSKDLQSNVFMVANKCEAMLNNPQSSGSLFDENLASKTKYLLPELKHADYLFKIEEDSDLVSLKNLLYEINQIKQVSSAFVIANDQLKSPQNLIFN